MRRRHGLLSLLLSAGPLSVILAGPPALAQEPPAEKPTQTPAGDASAPVPGAPAGKNPAPEAPAGASATPGPDAPPAAPGADPAAPAAPPLAAPGDDRVTELQRRIDALSDPISALRADVAAQKRLKVSGYVQGRYEWHDDADYGIEGTRPRETTRFLVRRGRLKTLYTGVMSECLLEIDATGDGVALKDAEASLVLNNENWLQGPAPWELKLTLGQFKIPFGFDVLQSSADHEMPELIAVVRLLYPGERDRGFRLQFTRSWFKLMGAIINGNFTNDPNHGSYDQTAWKDVVGRLQADLHVLVIGASGHVGRFLRQTRASSVAMPVAGYERYSRLRLGFDAEAYLDVPQVGGLQLRTEVIWARDHQLSFAEVAPKPDRCQDADRLGWSATAIQNIGTHFGVVLRVDQYDPTSSLADTCATPAVHSAADVDMVTDYGAGLMWYVSPNLKNLIAYEHLVEQAGKAVDNDILTIQMQARF